MGVIAGLDPKIPVTLFPVRIETRFAGPPAAPKLLVRLYPDDIHIDQHDPRLTKREVEAGKRYWDSIHEAVPADQAWKQLLKDVGARRAIWVREALNPSESGGTLAFPDVETIEGSTGIAAAARALPEKFIVRARYPGGEQTVAGEPVSDSLQVGISFGEAAEGAAPVQPTTDPNATLVLDEPMRWMVDFTAAKAAGMAVEFDLPPETRFIHDVTAVGVRTSDVDTPKTISSLIEAHRLSDGAAFIPPGTPTNNLADSESGYSLEDVPPPGPAAVPDEGSVAAVLAEAWNIDPAVLAPVQSSGSRELEEAQQMSRALFEATWGSFLRQQGQPGFDLHLLPQVYAHVTSSVRGGGAFPTIRIGRQPYGIIPVMARGDWVSLGEGRFLNWLAGFLPRIRRLWTGGVTRNPAGPELFAQEPFSTRVRLRTTNMSSVINYMIGSGNASVTGSPEVSRRTLFAELGFADVMPSLFTQVFPKNAADLWLPMAADGDTEFSILAPAPKDATSVLGLLLRNSALRIAANVTNEFAGLEGGAVATEIGRQPMTIPIANLPAAAGHAIPVLAGFTAEATITTPAVLAAAVGRDAAGDSFTIGERLTEIVAEPDRFRPDLSRYFNSDALAAFRDALVPLANIPTTRRAVLAGEIIDCASHRYDAWVTSLATARLRAMRSVKQGAQLGAWGTVRGIERRELEAVTPTDIIPPGTVRDPDSGGFVLAPSPRQANMAGVLRAAWLAHGGRTGGALAPFATGLTSEAVRNALTIAQGMRNGQPLGALLGYLLERGIHDASGINGIEIDWVVFELRRQYPLKVDTLDNAPQASAERLVVDGWKLAQVEQDAPGTVVAAIVVPPPPHQPSFGTPEKTALQKLIFDLLTTLDAFADLGLAESMYQMAGANFDRAAAATDMLGRAAPPPDSFESMETQRGGRGIEQRLVLSFGSGSRPAGYARSTPRARLAPVADAFVARKLGPISGLKIRLLDKSGTEIAAPKLSSLGLSALDLAALDLSLENIELNNIDSPSTMPGASNNNPGRQGLARLLLAAGVSEAANIGFDLRLDAEVLDLLDHAAAWQRTLAGRKPLSVETFAARASLETLAGNEALKTQVAALADELANAPATDLPAWGISGTDEAQVQKAASARVAAAAALGDPVEAAAALLGGPAVVEGKLTSLPADIETCVSSQKKLLGSAKGQLARWLQDSARVRPAVASLSDALLRDDLAGAQSSGSWAAQMPAAPYEDDVDPGHKFSWVGLPHPADVGAAPVICAVIIGDDARGAVTGIELDAWTEVVPSAVGTAGVVVNLSAPDARAPNVILMAVPPNVEQPWTEEALLSVVDEAIELADCRLVDLDATRRVPALLPACYLAEFDEDDLAIRRFLNDARTFPTRWVSRGGG